MRTKKAWIDRFGKARYENCHVWRITGSQYDGIGNEHKDCAGYIVCIHIPYDKNGNPRYEWAIVAHRGLHELDGRFFRKDTDIAKKGQDKWFALQELLKEYGFDAEIDNIESFEAFLNKLGEQKQISFSTEKISPIFGLY